MAELSPTARFVFPPGANFSYGGHNYTRNATDTIRAAMVRGRTDMDCYLADVPSPSLLKHLLKAEGGAAE